MLAYPNVENQDLEEIPFGSTESAKPAIALLLSMNLIDDFLDHINISLETYCKEFVGSWIFGYIGALQQAGTRPVLFCVSAKVSEVSYFTHEPTGIKICVLPASQSYLSYRALRHRALKTYGGNSEQSFTQINDSNLTRRSLLTKLKNQLQSVGQYLSLPLNTLARELKRQSCRAILCQEYENPRFDACVLLGQLIGVPVFATFQGGDKTQSALEYPFRRLAFRACAGVIISTQSEVERVQNHYPIPVTKIARVFDPMNTKTWYPLDRTESRKSLNIPLDARVVVCHGRIDWHRKGLDILVAAWEQICRDRPNIDLRLILVGTGPDSPKLHQYIKTMNLRGVIWRDEFVNSREEIQRYLSAADIYTMTSRQEGFPIAPLEAMACGLPIVASDAPGVPDILERGETSGGILVPRENVQALVEALGQLLDDLARCRELGKRARSRIEQSFSPEVVGQQLRHFLLK
jgi:starch synthase